MDRLSERAIIVRPAAGTVAGTTRCWKQQPSIFPMFLPTQYTRPTGSKAIGGYRTALGVPLFREGRADWRDRSAAHDGSTVHRQADCSGHDVSPTRPSSLSRIRACSTSCARTPCRIAAAADRHRRRAQGHQPLDLRSAGGAAHARRIGGAAVRGRYAAHIRRRRTEGIIPTRAYGFQPSSSRYVGDFRYAAGRGSVTGRVLLEGKPSTSLMFWPIRNTPVKHRSWAAFAPCSAFRCCARAAPIGVLVVDAHSCAARSPTSKSSW